MLGIYLLFKGAAKFSSITVTTMSIVLKPTRYFISFPSLKFLINNAYLILVFWKTFDIPLTNNAFPYSPERGHYLHNVKIIDLNKTGSFRLSHYAIIFPPNRKHVSFTTGLNPFNFYFYNPLEQSIASFNPKNTH